MPAARQPSNSSPPASRSTPRAPWPWASSIASRRRKTSWMTPWHPPAPWRRWRRKPWRRPRRCSIASPNCRSMRRSKPAATSIGACARSARTSRRTPMQFTTLRYGVEGGIATLTLDRPEARNALNRAMCDEIVAAMSAARDDAAVQLVLIRATGPVFCAGADLKERKGMAADEVRARRLAAYAAYGAIESLPMPEVAVMHGPSGMSGCDIAACCDFVVATPQATFATPEALWGTVGATQRMPRILGKQLAKDMMFTGRKLTV